MSPENAFFTSILIFLILLILLYLLSFLYNLIHRYTFLEEYLRGECEDKEWIQNNTIKYYEEVIAKWDKDGELCRELGEDIEEQRGITLAEFKTNYDNYIEMCDFQKKDSKNEGE